MQLFVLYMYPKCSISSSVIYVGIINSVVAVGVKLGPFTFFFFFASNP